jgi:hypothetical protein
MQKFNIYFITLISFFFISGERLSAQQFERQLNFCATASLWLPVLFENAGVDGADLCKVSGGTSCSFVSSLGEGICRAGGGSSCSFVTELGEGVCRAGGGTSCSFVSSLGEGICRAGGGTSCSFVTELGEGVCRAAGGTSCSFVSSLGEGICKASGICDFGGGSAIDIINAVVGMCGTRVLHYGYRGLK